MFELLKDKGFFPRNVAILILCAEGSCLSKFRVREGYWGHAVDILVVDDLGHSKVYISVHSGSVPHQSIFSGIDWVYIEVVKTSSERDS